MPPPQDLSIVEARRMALRAQGFGVETPARPGRKHLRNLITRLGAVQVDAVNVLARSHYLPAFSRLGPYDRSLFDRVAYAEGGAFEAFAHAASFVSADVFAALRWRMDAFASSERWRIERETIERANPGYVDRVFQEVADRGPLTFNELTDPARRERPKTKYAASSLQWWSPRPSDGKRVLERLWLSGRLAVAGRRAGFERAFDLAERVIPAEVLGRPTPTRDVAQRSLVHHAVRALAVAWLPDVADYYRLRSVETKTHLRALAEDGVVVMVNVEGVDAPAYVDPQATDGRIEARALLSPFDSLLWERRRNQRLFGFRHSFEIYVPEAKREFGYYVLPYLSGEAIVARVDLKADRKRGALLVPGAFAERGDGGKALGPELADVLRQTASWLGLERIEVGDRGDLAGSVRRALRSAPKGS